MSADLSSIVVIAMCAVIAAACVGSAVAVLRDGDSRSMAAIAFGNAAAFVVIPLYAWADML